MQQIITERNINRYEYYKWDQLTEFDHSDQYYKHRSESVVEKA